MKRLAIALTTATLLAVAAYFAWTGVPGRTPSGQTPLVSLDRTTLADLKTEFNRAAGGVRVLVLLSPT